MMCVGLCCLQRAQELCHGSTYGLVKTGVAVVCKRVLQHFVLCMMLAKVYAGPDTNVGVLCDWFDEDCETLSEATPHR